MPTPRKPIAFAIHDSLKASLSEANLEITQLKMTLEKRAEYNSDLFDRLDSANTRCIKVLDMYFQRDGMYDRLYDVASEFIFSCPEHREQTLDKLQSYFGYKGGPKDDRNRCPNCGRFIDDDPAGYFDRLDRDDDTQPIEVFCNEACADKYHEDKQSCT